MSVCCQGARHRSQVKSLILTTMLCGGRYYLQSLDEEHPSPKPCFLEGGRIRLAAPLWAASQCLPGRTAGRHILQTPASFVLLENIAHWYSKKYYRKSCDMESLGMPLHLSFEFSVRRCKGTLVGLDRVLQLQGGRVWI